MSFRFQPGRQKVALLAAGLDPSAWVFDDKLPPDGEPDRIGDTPCAVVRVLHAPIGAAFRAGDQVGYCQGPINALGVAAPSGYKPGAAVLVGPLMYSYDELGADLPLPVSHHPQAAALLDAHYGMAYELGQAQMAAPLIMDDPALAPGMAQMAGRAGYLDGYYKRPVRRHLPPQMEGGGPLPVAPTPEAAAYLQKWYELGRKAGLADEAIPRGPSHVAVIAVIAAGHADGLARRGARKVPIIDLGVPGAGAGLMGPPFYVEVYPYRDCDGERRGVSWQEAHGPQSHGSPHDPWGDLDGSDLSDLRRECRVGFKFYGFDPTDLTLGHGLCGPNGAIAAVVHRRFPMLADQDPTRFYGSPVWLATLDGVPGSAYIRILAPSELDDAIPGWRRTVRRALNKG